MLFGTKLVEAMKWIGKDEYGYWYTNGNLRTEADAMPTDVERDWTNIDQYRSWTEFWSYSGYFTSETIMVLSDGNSTTLFIQKQGTNETQHIYFAAVVKQH